MRKSKLSSICCRDEIAEMNVTDDVIVVGTLKTSSTEYSATKYLATVALLAMAMQ